MPKNFDSRSQRQEAEGYASVNTELPSDRFQGKKQVLKPEEMSVTAESIPESVANVKVQAAKTLKSKIKIRPDVSVEELADKQVGGVPLAVNASLLNVAGATKQSPVDDASRVPYSGGNYRPTTRYAKKRSEDLFELDNTISEQVVPVVEDLEDLREAPDLPVGYNGRKQFKQTRSKKNFAYTNGDGRNVGKLPQQLLNEASADFVDVNHVVYTSGQIINTVDSQADYPTVTYDAQTGRMDGVPEAGFPKGNYRPTELVIEVLNGHINRMDVEEDRYVVSGDPLTRDQANMNWQVDANNVAKTMVKIQTEMGRETTDKWTPLAYVIGEPYQYNMLMHDIEAMTGAYMATAYRAAVSSLAYQRNISKKDGVDPQRNAFKMIYEGYAGVLSRDDLEAYTAMPFGNGNITGDNEGCIFNKAEYRRGSVAGLINMFDSVTKYRTKADLLGLQRSLPLHLSQADNNLDMLRVKPSFMKALDAAHYFSTIDGTYNPMLPIFQTKRIGLINACSLKPFFTGWRHPNSAEVRDDTTGAYDKLTGTYATYRYAYSDLRNKYVTRVQHPLVDGLIRWLLKHEGAFVSTFCTGDSGTIRIPIIFDMQNPGLFQFMLCSAAQDVAWERNIIFRDVLFAGEQSTYIWDDLVSLKDADPLKSTQLTIGKYDEPLQLGKLRPDTAIRLMWSDHMQLSDADGGWAQYFLPWHFNERAFGNVAGGSYTANEGFFCEETAFNASMPSIRGGVRHEYVDLIKSMDPGDILLSLDRRIAIPEFCTLTNITEALVQPEHVYELPHSSTDNNDRIKLSTIRYDANSDGRMVAKYLINSATSTHREFYAKGLYCIPKELGLIDFDFQPFEVITSVLTAGASGITSNGSVITFNSRFGAGTDSNYYNGGLPIFLTSYRVSADSPSDGSIDRSAALTQVFYRCFASTGVVAGSHDVNQHFVNRTGIVPAIALYDQGIPDVPGIYNLGSNNESTHAVDVRIRSAAPYFWTILQRLFFPVNPFANCFSVNTTNHAYDPLEESFFFGVCGTLAADYTQMVLERLDTYDQLGKDYTEDVYHKKSLILR